MDAQLIRVARLATAPAVEGGLVWIDARAVALDVPGFVAALAAAFALLADLAAAVTRAFSTVRGVGLEVHAFGPTARKPDPAKALGSGAGLQDRVTIRLALAHALAALARLVDRARVATGAAMVLARRHVDAAAPARGLFVLAASRLAGVPRAVGPALAANSKLTQASCRHQPETQPRRDRGPRDQPEVSRLASPR